MTSTDAWTILRLIQWTTGYLREHGSESPRLDAEVLLAHCRGSSRIEIYTAFESEADEELRGRFRELVRKRAQGTPVAYLVGSREFFSRPFEVTPDVLIPRPESEFLVTSLLDRCGPKSGRERPYAIADIGTGSGILAITACLELPQAQVWASDISPAALEVARGNARKHEVIERIEFVQADLWNDLECGPRFDFVLSNPPYLSEKEWTECNRSIRDFEPRVALVAGPHGDAVIARLIPAAAERLRPGGWLLMEISPMIEQVVRDRIAADERFAEVHVIRDFAKLPRVVAARRTNQE